MPEPRKSRYPGVYPSGKSSWQYKLRLPPDPVTGKRKMETRGGYATDLEAHTARSARMVELGLGINTAPTDLTVTEAVTQWLDGRTMKASSRFQYNYLLRRFITPHVGALRVRDLTPAKVRAWQVLLLARGREGNRPLAPSTAANCRALLSSALDQLRKDGALARNVVELTDGVTIPRHRAVTWTADEARQFLSASDQDEYAALWRLGLFSLLRPGELVALRWQDVNLQRGIVTIAQTATRDAAGVWTVGDPKTPASAAPVGLSAVTVTQLRALADIQRLTNRYRPDGWRTDLVFPSRVGGMLNNSTLTSRLTTLCKRADVPVIGAHSLRRTGAELAIKSGVDPTTLMRTLRHERAEFSLNLYTQSRLSDVQNAVVNVEAGLEAERDDETRRQG